jgi:hypothetical protein
MRPHEEGKEVEEGSWTRCKTKRSHGQAGSSCWRPAAQRGDFGRRRCDVAGPGNASGVGRAAGGRAGGQVVRVGQRGEASGQVDCRCGGGGRRSSETEREGRAKDDEDLSIIFQKSKGFIVK